MLCKTKRQMGISEAIAILKSWNNKWKPVAFMVDNCDEGHCKKYRNFTWFRANRPKLRWNCAFPQNFYTRKSGEITVFFAVEINVIEEHFLGSNNNKAVLDSKIFNLLIAENWELVLCIFATILNYFLAAVTHGCYTNKLSRQYWHAINNGIHGRFFHVTFRRSWKELS